MKINSSLSFFCDGTGEDITNKTKMKTKIFFSLMLASMLASAQPYVHQVIFLNEGHYDYTNQVQTVPVTIGVYSPVTKIYSVVDTIPNARFGSDVIVDG